MIKIKLNIEPNIESLEKTRESVNNAIIQLVGDQPWLYELNLAIEEVIVNIIDHGSKAVTINVTLERKNNELVVEIIDTSIPFDITKKEVPDLQKHYREYKNRGLGVFLIKNIADNLKYRYENGKNILTIIKRIEAKC
ncbi:MAG TPA: ATP-binding protein [Spirochaetota bacterium]|mgnify:CR=1 FL=1|nr:ATP-binding protein [Spirochaetota bacterium]HOM38758.1 ATP-binding protein [Spirochaetota bacterium]HPQ49556.1 ATP-binding protein [Spirochaetota bacterium]